MAAKRTTRRRRRRKKEEKVGSAKGRKKTPPEEYLDFKPPESPGFRIGVHNEFAFAAPTRVFEAKGNAEITVVRTGNTSGTAGVRYRTQDGTALDGLNYVAAAGTLEFAPLQTDAVIRIELLQDHVFRGRPHFYLELYESSVPARLDRRRQIVVHDREPGMVTGSTFTWLEGKKEMEFDVTALDWHDGYQVEDSFDLIQWNPNGLVRHFGPRRPGFVYSSGVSKTTFEMLEIGREERRFFRIRRP